MKGTFLKALKAGARAYLLKDSAEQDLINAVKAVSEGKSLFQSAISKMLGRGLCAADAGTKVGRQLRATHYTRTRNSYSCWLRARITRKLPTLLEPEPAHSGDPSGNIFQKLNLHSGRGIDLYAVRKGVIT